VIISSYPATLATLLTPTWLEAIS